MWLKRVCPINAGCFAFFGLIVRCSIAIKKRENKFPRFYGFDLPLMDIIVNGWTDVYRNRSSRPEV